MTQKFIAHYFLALAFVLVPTTVMAQTILSGDSKTLDTSGSRVEWRASLGGEFMEDRLSEARLTNLRALIRAFHPFSSSLSANLEAGFSLETGNTQNLFTDEFQPKQTLLLQEARITWRPVQFFGVWVGALDQNHHGSPIFIADKTFPGILEFFEFTTGDFTALLNAQQAIPVSRTYSTRSVGKEPSPFFYTGSLRLAYSVPKAWEAVARGTYFVFKNLTRGIAQDSRFYGNTVTGIGPEGARFFYRYRGFEAGLDVSANLSANWSIFAGNSYVKNSDAPAALDDSSYFFGGVTYASSRLSITPRFGSFRIEGDSSPAFYTNKRFGHNNRKGLVGALSVHLVPEKLSIEGQYVKADLINARPNMADRTYWEIRLITDYLPF